MRFYLVDVFAEQKYQGNQLAVLIPDAPLSTEEMQRITKEINFSESSFIMSGKQADGGYKIRIFTPDAEVPFAGHPTLGTAFVIQQVLAEATADKVCLNLGVGQIQVTFDGEELTMEQKEPTFGKVIEQPSVMAEILQIDSEDFASEYPIQVVSTGLPSVIVPLKSLEAVKRCTINHAAFREFLAHTRVMTLLVFALEADNPENDLQVRVFMDDTGYREDPATGSANGNLAGYFLQHNVFGRDKLQLRIEQGAQIGRPSLVKLHAEKTDGKFNIRIGGKVFFVAKGEWLS